MMTMRWLVLVFMMLLLPLRGWTGDAMATSMALNKAQPMSASSQATTAQASHGPAGHETHHATKHSSGSPDLRQPVGLMAEVSASAADAAHVSAAGHEATADCPGQAHADPTHPAHAGGDGCESCSACQTCHTVALVHVEAGLQLHPLTRSSRPAMATSFASADPAGDSKPPIF